MRERFDEMRRMGIRTVMITGDNPLTAKAIAEEAGVDDFLAEATPEDKMELIRKEQAGGRLVAMTGDGTNDAPALAQADVGVAMNTGTSAAKEAGNMVDLDSDPTKLIEIVEIGKQLLITRGALTTFSISNDIAKYFAIIPAMFASVYPGLDRLNIMGLASPQSAILSAVIFNALVIIALIPLALRGVSYRPGGAAALLRRNLLSTAPAASSPPSSESSSSTCWSSSSPGWPDAYLTFVARHLAAARALLVFTLLLGLGYPLAMVGVAQLPGLTPKADGSLIPAAATVVGSRLIGQSFTDADGNPMPAYFQSRPSAAGDGYDPTATSASNLGPEDVVDTAGTGPEPADPGVRPQPAVGELEGVDGSRPYCTDDGIGAVLGVYYADGLTGESCAWSASTKPPARPSSTEYADVPVELRRCR